MSPAVWSFGSCRVANFSVPVAKPRNLKPNRSWNLAKSSVARALTLFTGALATATPETGTQLRV